MSNFLIPVTPLRLLSDVTALTRLSIVLAHGVERRDWPQRTDRDEGASTSGKLPIVRKKRRTELREDR